MPGGAHENMKQWEPEEDQLILDMIATMGKKWKQIVQRLPGRTESSVRNRHQRMEKGRQLIEAGKTPRNRCHTCGQPKRGHVCYAKMSGGPQVQIKKTPLTVAPTCPAPPSGGFVFRQLASNIVVEGSRTTLPKLDEPTVTFGQPKIPLTSGSNIVVEGAQGNKFDVDVRLADDVSLADVSFFSRYAGIETPDLSIPEPSGPPLPPPLVSRKSSRLSFSDLADIFSPSGLAAAIAA